MIVNADARALPIRAGTVQTCVTSPPYWGLRDYGVPGQLGLERTPDEYVANMVAVFREVWRVLRDDGTLWLNLGDSYVVQGGGGETRMIELHGSGSGGIHSAAGKGQLSGKTRQACVRCVACDGEGFVTPCGAEDRVCYDCGGHGEINLPPKNLVGIPWRVAFALQQDGWYLRSDIIWSKPNPMPESVTDRPTKAHEYLFLLAKSQRYYYDAEAIREEAKPNSGVNMRAPKLGPHRADGNYDIVTTKTYDEIKGANRRSVWTVTTQPYRGAHFAVMPEALVEPCIKAGSKPGDLVLDPFAGSGTVGVVARRFGRTFVGAELNPAYIELARLRMSGVQMTIDACA